MEKEILLTKEGMAELEKELEYLKTVKRREIAQRIKEAIALGDISENSEYDEAKNEQAQIERRISVIEQTLRKARVIEANNNSDEVGLGSTVVLKDLEFDEEFTYTVVGSAEANPSKNKISNESPVGKAILGRKKGEIVDVTVPAGVVQYQIVDIIK